MSLKNNENRKDLNVKALFIWFALASVTIIILVPCILEYAIFRNEFISVITNGEWASFYGSFVGGILGAVVAGVVTIYGIKLSIEHNYKIVKEEREIQADKEKEKEILSNKPFLHFSFKGLGGGLQNTYFVHGIASATKYNLELRNIGMNSAINVECRLDYNDFSNNRFKRDLFENKKVINKDNLVKIDLAFPYHEGRKTLITIRFEDILGNIYEQEIFFQCINSQLECINHKPLLIKEQ